MESGKTGQMSEMCMPRSVGTKGKRGKEGKAR